MRSDISAPTTATSRTRSVTVTIYPVTETPREVLLGTATGGVDFTGLVKGCNQTDVGASVTLTLASNTTMPTVDQMVSISVGSDIVFNGYIDTISTDLQRGNPRRMVLNVRRRDMSDLWRTAKKIADPFYTGIDLSDAAKSIIASTGILQTDEYDLPNLGVTVAHDDPQLADMPIWSMLQAIAFPGVVSPYVDALGKLKWISRNVHRQPDITYSTWNAIKGVIHTGSSRPVSNFRINWIDPLLSEAKQVERELIDPISLRPGQGKRVYWSDNLTTRVDTSTLRHTIEYDFRQRLFRLDSETGGMKDITPYGAYLYAPIIRYEDMADWYAEVDGESTESALSRFNFYASSGTFQHIIGVHSVRGVVIDRIYNENKTDAYNNQVPVWRENLKEVSSSLIPNLEVALGVARAELHYHARAADRISLPMVDDLRVEPGDLIQIPSGEVVYVEGFSRDLTRGANAILNVSGFVTTTPLTQFPL